MLRRMMIATLMAALLAMTPGCSLFRSIDNSSPEEMRKFQATKDDLWDQAQALEREKAAAQKQLADREAEIARVKNELAYWQNETAQADGRFVELNKTVEVLNTQLKQQREPAPQQPQPPPQGKQLLIKVLAGNGKIAAAHRLAKKLEGLGYRIEATDLARRWDYKVTTIFYGPGNKNDAAAMAKRLGKGVIIKPRTWRSVYNLLVVSGRRP
ncbi:MAG: LytR C-terminal domain-containing protein [Syntrophales bacterium]